jgi:hypothetical protein
MLRLAQIFQQQAACVLAGRHASLASALHHRLAFNTMMCITCVSLLQSLRQVLRAHPYIWIVSVLLTVVLMTAGVVGVLAAAQTETRHRKDSATGACNGLPLSWPCTSAAGFEQRV